MLDFLEKPSIEDAPSRMACLGRLSPFQERFFKIFRRKQNQKKGEIQLTDGIYLHDERWRRCFSI